MISYLKDLKKILEHYDDREWFFKANAGSLKRTFRAFKYCFLRGYSRTDLTGSEFISLQQLEDEKHALMKFVPEVDFERFENLYFGLGTRIKTAIFIGCFAQFQYLIFVWQQAWKLSRYLRGFHLQMTSYFYLLCFP